jgi:hypothetical protein
MQLWLYCTPPRWHQPPMFTTTVPEAVWCNKTLLDEPSSSEGDLMVDVSSPFAKNSAISEPGCRSFLSMLSHLLAGLLQISTPDSGRTSRIFFHSCTSPALVLRLEASTVVGFMNVAESAHCRCNTVLTTSAILQTRETRAAHRSTT